MKGAIRNEWNRAGRAYLKRVLGHIKTHPCRNGHRKKPGGCMGEHEDCHWAKLWTQIVLNAKDDELFTAPDSSLPVRTLGGLTKEEHIAQMQLVVASDPNLRFDDETQIRDIDRPGTFGRRMTHEAVLANDLRKLEDLLAMGADFSLRDNNHQTPYQLAKQEELAKVVALLEQFDLAIE